MFSEKIATIIQMIESLPETAQEKVIEHLREYIIELQDELEWDSLVEKTQLKLIAAARRSKQEITEGLAQSLDYDQL
ncbi:hypothetical protein H6G17_13900 [Chroococcidiopsis sp. FACHB-1243]|uniref:hypothetical protein n=1 Tax=Chroococcidiopsis sp. [FACHB-1243] TaxID=2692781 RepID=UPI0017813914|nr:hypothetical protein [Chroococcidiopsis sp. [FACHB-1243]]MBD2306602.1 hypothetical protein [Chroococcidiopsis sp. [FACHB-1243]]